MSDDNVVKLGGSSLERSGKGRAGRAGSQSGTEWRQRRERSGSVTAMPWVLSWRADPRAREIADRHYNRQKVGAPQFVPPGKPLVLLTPDALALWISHWPIAEYVKHAWAGAWMCTCFRNEARERYLSSDLIRAAVAATVAAWGSPPALGMVTFVDPDRTHRKRDPGRCFRKAGFAYVGETMGGLVSLQLLPSEMPEMIPALGSQESLFAAVPQ